MTKKTKELLDDAAFMAIFGTLFFLLIALVIAPNIELCLLGAERWFIECDVADYGWNEGRTAHYERVLKELDSIAEDSFYGNLMVNGNFILQAISLVVQAFIIFFSSHAGIAAWHSSFRFTKRALKTINFF